MRILILRSCRLPQFYQAVEFLKARYPDASLSVLAQAGVCPELAKDSRLTEVILYPASTFSAAALDSELAATITAKQFDFTVIIYSNVSGAGFQNVHEFAARISLPVYVFDKTGNFYRYAALTNLKQRFQKLWQKMFWEQLVNWKVGGVKRKIANADAKLDLALGEERSQKIRATRQSFVAVALEINKLKERESKFVEITRYNPVTSIIIVNLNGRYLLAECLPSLRQAIEFSGQSHEVIIVDNGSTDGSLEFLRRDYPTYKVIPLLKNEGFPRGCNLGARQAAHEILVFLNNDLIVEKDFFIKLLPPLERKLVFAVSAKAFVAGTKELNQGKTNGIIEEGFLRTKTQDSPDLEATLYAMGGGCAVNRKKFEKLQGFDEMFTPGYCEDMDICIRAWRRGWESLYVPGAILHHKVNTTTKRIMTPREIQVLATRNNLLFCWKNFLEADILETHWQNLTSKINLSLAEKNDILWQAFTQARAFTPLITAKRRTEKLEGTLSLKEILDITGF